MTTRAEWKASPARARIRAHIATLDMLLTLGPNPAAEAMIAGLRLAMTEVREDAGHFPAALLAPHAVPAVVVDRGVVAAALAKAAPLQESTCPPTRPVPPVPAAPAAGAAPVGGRAEPPAEVSPGGGDEEALDAPPPGLRRPHWTQTETPEARRARMAKIAAAVAAKRAPAPVPAPSPPPLAPAGLPLVTPANRVVPRAVPNWTLPTTEPPLATARNFAPAPAEAPSRLQAVGPMAPAAVGGVTELPALAAVSAPETADAKAAARLARARGLLEDGENEHLVAAAVKLPLREVYRLKGELRRGIGARG